MSPYVSAQDYRRVQHLLAPPAPGNAAELQALEADIYALNRHIRAVPGDHPTPEWQNLTETHRRLLAVYHAAGGTKL